MKVLHLGKYLPPSKGGMENSILHICEKVSESATCSVFLAGAPVETTFTPQEINSKINIVALKKLTTLASTPILFGVSQIVKKIKPDVIHIHLPNPWLSLWTAVLRIPLVVTYHCDVPNYPLLKKFYGPILKWNLKKAKVIFVTSPQMLENNSDIRDFKEKTKVVSLSIPDYRHDQMMNAEKKAQEEENKITAEHLKDKHGEKIILFVGRLVSYKGLEYLIEAMSEVNGKLLIVGKGPLHEPLSQLIAKLNLKNKVILEGFVSDENLISYYKACKLVVLPSINESEALGVCLIEALSFACPLVTTKINTGVSYANVTGETGIEVEPKDVKGLAMAINTILDDELKHAQFSKASRRRFETTFNLREIAQEHINTYQSILRTKGQD